MKLDDIKIYRMTHIQNLPHILAYGVTHRCSLNADLNYVSIGDVGLINTRASKVVFVTNGSVFSSGVRITLGDFIPFYFGVRMPMLYVVQRGGNLVPRPVSPEHIIYISCNIIDIINSGISFYFSDGHATDTFSSFYDRSQVARLPEIIDWMAVKSVNWGGSANMDVKRKKQAEFLIGSDIPSSLLAYFGCYNDAAKTYLLSVGVTDAKIKVVPAAYF